MQPVAVYWVSETDGSEVFNAKLDPGERSTNSITSFIGHQFVVHTQQRSCRFRRPHATHGTQRICRGRSQKHPHQWSRHSKVNEPSLHSDSTRAASSTISKPASAAITTTARHKRVFVNYWEADVNFIQIPWNLKRKWQGRLKELVGAWLGLELETTDMYSMREYTKGVRLVTHVDRESTHAASLIVNIAQENVTRPWTIEVNNHTDRLHQETLSIASRQNHCTDATHPSRVGNTSTCSRTFDPSTIQTGS